jgi:3-oxoacyl-[acyl-carrier protein] reductase
MNSPTTRTALVTGSTKGIGRGIALRLAQDGHAVALNYASDDAAAEKTLNEMRAIQPRSCVLRADVLTPDGCARLVREAGAALGRIDVLVNNVGPFVERPLAETDDELWRQMLDGNLSSAFWCARAVLPAMRARKSGSIVMVSALSADISPGMTHDAPAYFVAKAGLATLTRTLARLEGPHGIRVNAVSPGFIETESYADWAEDSQQRWRRQIPIGRFGRPEEVGDAVAFLVSDRAAYVSGSILHVHGGLWV